MSGNFYDDLYLLCKIIITTYVNKKIMKTHNTRYVDEIRDLRDCFLKFYEKATKKLNIYIEVDKDIGKQFPFLTSNTIYDLLLFDNDKYFFVIYKAILSNIF